MPAPATIDAFLAVVRKSQLANPDRLENYLKQLNQTDRVPTKPRELGDLLAEEGLLTFFQAQQLLRGKWRGFTIGNYRVLERLGFGAMGAVFLCEHQTMRHRVAIKVVPAKVSDKDPSALERFQREARVSGLLDHPNIVRAHDIDQEGKMHFLVMDFADGASLYDIVRHFGPMDVLRACHYIRQAALGLDYAHQVGVIHRDIKPSNLLLERTGVIKILDLGLARFYLDKNDLLTSKYDENMLLGTADYMAPEQAVNGHGVDGRADIYSLGATFYFLLTGRPVFDEGSTTQKLIWHQMRQPQSIRDQRPEVPAELQAIVDRMMAKEPDKRYQKLAEVVIALAPWTETPIPPPSADEMPRLSPAARIGKERDQSASDGSTVKMKAPQAPTVVKKDPSQPTAGAPAPIATADWTVTSPASSIRRAFPPELVPVAAFRRLLSPGHSPRWWAARAIPVLVAVAIAGYWLWPISRPSPVALSAATNSKPAEIKGGIHLIATATGADKAFPTLREAMASAKPGDRILIKQETFDQKLWLEGDGTLGTDVSVEGAAPSGRPVHWRLPPDFPQRQPLIKLAAVAGFRLNGFHIDGGHRVDDLIVLSARCPGLTLKDLHLEGFRRAAVKVSDCSGQDRQPLSFSRLRTTSEKESASALAFEGVNRHVHVQDCRFEGPFRSAVQIQGTALGIQFQRNRIFKGVNGLLVKTSEPRCRLQLNLAQNTFCDLQTGLYFEDAPAVADSRLEVTNNLFLRVQKLTQLSDFAPMRITPAQWIWFNEGATGLTAPADNGNFRRVFEVPGTAIAKAGLDIQCDDAFRVWLNGKLVGEGEFYYYTRRVYGFDVSAHLRSGKNVLAVEGTNRPLTNGAPSNAGLLVHLSCVPTGAPLLTVVTDQAWKVAKSAPAGWQELTFDDAAWPAARVLAPYGKGDSARQSLIWDSVVQEHFQGVLRPFIPNPAGNIRDWSSQDGFPSLESRGYPGNFPLALDPRDDAGFLRYPKTDALFEAGVDRSPVGAPPAK